MDMCCILYYGHSKLYIELYVWHLITRTIHKSLLHGSIIIEKALLLIKQLSEEAAEARNKHFRLYRLKLRKDIFENRLQHRYTK